MIDQTIDHIILLIIYLTVERYAFVSMCCHSFFFLSFHIGSTIIEKGISCRPWKREGEKNTVQRPEGASSSLEVLSSIISFNVANKLNRILPVISLSLPLSLSRHRISRMHVGSTMSNLVTGCLRVTLCRMNSEEKSFYSFSHFVSASMATRTDKILIRSCSCYVVFHEEKKTDETSSEQMINIDGNPSTYQFGQSTRVLPSRTFSRHLSP